MGPQSGPTLIFCYVCLCDESARAFSMFSNDSPRGCGEISILNLITIEIQPALAIAEA